MDDSIVSDTDDRINHGAAGRSQCSGTVITIWCGESAIGRKD